MRSITVNKDQANAQIHVEWQLCKSDRLIRSSLILDSSVFIDQHVSAPKTWDLYGTLMCLSIGTPKTINLPFVSNGKLMILGVPIFKHIIMRL